MIPCNIIIDMFNDFIISGYYNCHLNVIMDPFQCDIFLINSFYIFWEMYFGDMSFD